MIKKQWLAALALGVSMSAHAADFSDADAKFAKRDVSLEATQAARAAYKVILNSGVTNADLIRAAEGYLRSTVFEATHFYGTVVETERAARKALSGECWRNGAEAVNPTKLGYASPVYYYFRAACIAYEAEVSTPAERLGLLTPLNNALQTGLGTQGGTTYEGGGLLRVTAAVKGNPEAQGLPGGLYNPEEALKLINLAIDSQAYPGNAEGAFFCENFRRKAMTLKELKLQAQSLETADQALADFPSYLEEGLIPEFIRAETDDCLKLIQALKAGN